MKTPNPLKTLVVGCGHMGSSHARAYAELPDFQIVGLVSRGESSRNSLAQALGLPGLPLFADYTEALRETRPDVVCVATYPETHADFAIQAMRAGAHVFLEKPIATSVHDAQKVVAVAGETGRKLVVGYILRHHPSWQKFIEIARTLGKPLVMRMNLNQQSSGHEWEVHRNLIAALPPMVDCGVHYVDVMCQMTRSKPVRVRGISANLAPDVLPGSPNYGQLQVAFADGSVGWYEAGWGPMMSEEAYFIKDVIGPLGSVSMVASRDGTTSDDVESHTKTSTLRIHHSELAPDGTFLRKDVFLDTSDEPTHDELCRHEQEFLLRAIREELPLDEHLVDAVHSLQIVLDAQKDADEQNPTA
jgi:predicted dehydrogenase